MNKPANPFEEIRRAVLKLTAHLEQEFIKCEVMRLMLDRFAPSDWAAQLDRMSKDEKLLSQVKESNAPILKEFEDAMYQAELEIELLRNPTSGKPN